MKLSPNLKQRIRRRAKLTPGRTPARELEYLVKFALRWSLSDVDGIARPTKKADQQEAK